MSRSAVARNYADTLLELASREEGREADDRGDGADGRGDGAAWLAMLSEVAGLYGTSPPFKAFLDTPRVGEKDKIRVLREAFAGRYPERFIRFVLLVLQKRRQGLLPDIEAAARDLLYERTGRLHASVTLIDEPDAEFRREIEGHLSTVLDREVDADFRVDPRLIGGMVVRVGDRVLDGSVRRRLQTLRRSLLDNHTQPVE